MSIRCPYCGESAGRGHEIGHAIDCPHVNTFPKKDYLREVQDLCEKAAREKFLEEIQKWPLADAKMIWRMGEKAWREHRSK